MRDSDERPTLRIQLGEQTLALPAEIVREIAEPMTVTPLPGTASAILGVGAHRGVPIVVVDGRRLVAGDAAASRTGPGALVLCDVGGRRIGLEVDDVLGVGAAAVRWDLAAALAPLFDG